MVKTNRPSIPAQHFGLAWALMTSIGWATGLLTGLILSDLVARIITIMNETAYTAGDFLGDIVAGLIVGMVVGNLQWLWLKRQAPQYHGWARATILGTASGFLLTRILGNPIIAYSSCGPLFCFGFSLPPAWLPSPFGLVTYRLGGPITGAIVGAIVGLSQWLSMRQKALINGWWVLISSLSLGIGFLIGSLAGIISAEVSLAALLTGISIAIISTPSMVRQMKREIGKQSIKNS